MKRIIFILATLLISNIAFNQDITGEWNGALSVQGMKLRLVFHITQSGQNYTATMDSPDQGAKGIAMTATSFENNILTLEHSLAKIKYTGNLIKADSIIGNFVQGGQQFPLILTRHKVAVEKIKHPQEPVKPFPYNSEDITFENSIDSITLAGTFTYPKTAGKFKTVILVSGSGPQNRDEEILGHKPFLLLSDFLTRNGIAVLRFDDRGCYESNGDFAKATSNDFAKDIEAAVKYLRTRKEVNTKKIGIIGHSEGGIIAPLVAVKDKNINFIVLMAGPGISGGDIIIRQTELIGRANGVTETDLQESIKSQTQIIDYLVNIKNMDSLKVKLDSHLRLKMLENPDMRNNEKLNELVNQQITQLTSPWYLNFIRYNPAPTLEKVKCSVLAIIGSKDLQVPSEENLNAIKKALTKAKNKKFIVKELAGLNHLFQECKTGAPGEYATIEQTISPVALDIMLKWITSK